MLDGLVSEILISCGLDLGRTKASEGIVAGASQTHDGLELPSGNSRVPVGQVFRPRFPAFRSGGADDHHHSKPLQELINPTGIKVTHKESSQFLRPSSPSLLPFP